MIAYKITNTITGKIYIGITSKTIERRFDGHLSAARHDKRGTRPFIKALREYPFDCWKIEIIGTAKTWESLCSLERSLIEQHRSTSPAIGYNVTLGGQGNLGYVPTEAMRVKLAETARAFHQGRKRPPETGRRISAALRASRHLRGRAVSPKQDPERDAQIMAHYSGSRNMRLTGEGFSITAGAVHAALARCRKSYEEGLQAASRLYFDHKAPRIIPPDFLGYVFGEFR